MSRQGNSYEHVYATTDLNPLLVYIPIYSHRFLGSKGLTQFIIMSQFFIQDVMNVFQNKI